MNPESFNSNSFNNSNNNFNPKVGGNMGIPIELSNKATEREKNIQQGGPQYSMNNNIFSEEKSNGTSNVKNNYANRLNTDKLAVNKNKSGVIKKYVVFFIFIVLIALVIFFVNWFIKK